MLQLNSPWAFTLMKSFLSGKTQCVMCSTVAHILTAKKFTVLFHKVVAWALFFSWLLETVYLILLKQTNKKSKKLELVMHADAIHPSIHGWIKLDWAHFWNTKYCSLFSSINWLAFSISWYVKSHGHEYSCRMAIAWVSCNQSFCESGLKLI